MNFTNPVLLRIIRTLSFTTNNKDINPILIGALWSDQVPGYVVPYAASLVSELTAINILIVNFIPGLSLYLILSGR